MTSDWPVIRLSDLISIKHGFAFKGAFFSDAPTDAILVTPGNFAIGGGFKTDKLKFYNGSISEDYELKPDDLVVTMTDLSKQADTLGYSALIPNHPSQRYLHNQRIGLVEIKSHKLDKLYLYFLLRSQEYRHHVVSSATGSTVKHTSPSKIASFEFRLPPLKIQTNLGRALKSLEDKVQINSQINQTLEQMAQAIFKSWFVDFEPVKAKIAVLEAGDSAEDALLAAMRAISGKNEAQLTLLQTEQPEQYAELRATAELFPSAMQESELGEIPEGWEVLSLSEMVELIGGGTPKKSELSFWNGSICWFSVKDTPNEGNVFVVDTEEKITEEGLKHSSTKLLPLGTTIITARGTVGKLALTGVATAMNQSCYGVIGCDGTGPYLNYLRLKNAVDTLKQNTHGAVFDTITRSTFETVIQPRSCLALRQRFEKFAQPLFEEIRNNLLQSNALSETRDLLLPKLLSGELRLPEVEGQIQEAADAV